MRRSVGRSHARGSNSNTSYRTLRLNHASVYLMSAWCIRLLSQPTCQCIKYQPVQLCSSAAGNRLGLDPSATVAIPNFAILDLKSLQKTHNPPTARRSWQLETLSSSLRFKILQLELLWKKGPWRMWFYYNIRRVIVSQCANERGGERG